MISLFQRLTPQGAKKHEAQPEQAREFLSLPVASMVPLQPPTATNDDPLKLVYTEVKRELQVSGYLR